VIAAACARPLLRQPPFLMAEHETCCMTDCESCPMFLVRSPASSRCPARLVCWMRCGARGGGRRAQKCLVSPRSRDERNCDRRDVLVSRRTAVVAASGDL